MARGRFIEHHGRRGGRGFTLAELLVCVGIIAGLIGLALPVLARVRGSAASVVCKSREHQIGIGLLAYTHDHEGRWPDARYMPRPFISVFDAPPLYEVVADYVETGSGHRAYRCPGDQKQVFPLARTSYFYPPLLAGQRFGDEPFLDYAEWTEAQTPVLGDFDNGLFLTEMGELDVSPFHTRRNFVFADGHVGHLEADRRVSYEALR